MKGGRLQFKAKDVLALAIHAQNSKEFKPTMEEAYNYDADFVRRTDAEIKAIVKPALHFVKDQGVYLMSNGKPGFYIYDKNPKLKELLKKHCSIIHKTMLKDIDFWHDRVVEYVMAQDMQAIDFVRDFYQELPDKYKNALKKWQFNNHSVTYAEGLNPAKDDAWYDIAHHICGGDDFVENVPVNFILSNKSLIEKDIAKWFIIDLKEETMSFKFNAK